MELEKFFLRVKAGSKIVSSKGDFIVKEVPKDALERIRGGCTWLGLTNGAVELLSSFSKIELKSLLRLRKEQGFDDDVKVIEKALKSSQKQKKAEDKKEKS